MISSEPPINVLLVISTGLMCFRHMQLGVFRFAVLHPRWRLTLCTAEEDYASLIARRRPDGLILGPLIRHHGIAPVVSTVPAVVGLCGNHEDYGLPGLAEVNIDNHAVGVAAANAFLDKGYRHFAYVGSDNPWARRRGQGFRDGLAKHGQTAAEIEQVWASLSIVSEPTATGAAPRLGDWLLAQPKPLALLACNDVRGRDAVQLCRQLGLQVPDEVAVMGVDDDDLICAMSNPPLSSVAMPWLRTGHRAADLLHRQMTGEPVDPGQHLFPPVGITERQSTGAIAIEDPEVRGAVQFVRANAGRPISVDDVVAAVGTVTRRSLERRFRTILGRTPLEEIRDAHFARAKLLLTGSEIPIDQVARGSGFTDPEWFAKAFRDRFGESPRAYRERNGGADLG